MEHRKNVKSLRRYLKANNRKYTVEREEMLRLIATMEGHYSLNDLYKKSRKRNVIHAKSTIYRNIFLFIDAGFIKEIRMLSGQTVYETNRHDQHSDYLLCVACGSLDTFISNSIEQEQRAICKAKDFEPLSHVHLIKGYCTECQEKLQPRA